MRVHVLALAMTACATTGVQRVGSGAPDWVLEGSGLEDGVIRGLGSVSGVHNSSLARATAGNRGRAEISRILEVYSVSLLRDYQASTSGAVDAGSDESQDVQQAIKTFSASLLNGSEVEEYWFDADRNTWYALVTLDLRRSERIQAAQARLPSMVREWLGTHESNVMEDLEAELARRSRDDVTRDGAAVTGPFDRARQNRRAARGGDGSDAAEGDAPSWLSGACARRVYLCGVGSGATREAADSAARAELARIFVAQVQAVQESFDSANRTVARRTGESWVEVQRVSSYSLVSTDKLLRFSEIQARYQHPDGHLYSLAVIDRAQASAALRHQIEQLDQGIRSDLDRLNGLDRPLDRYRILRSVLNRAARRATHNGDLMVIEGSGMPSSVGVPEILSRMDGLQFQLRFGLKVTGEAASTVRACLQQGLVDRGFDVVDDYEATDVAIEAVVRAQQLEQMDGNQVVQAELVIQLTDIERGRRFATVRGSAMATRPTVERAVSTAAVRLCRQQIPDLLEQVERQFGG